MLPVTSALLLMSLYLNQEQKKNECGGIIAFIEKQQKGADAKATQPNWLSFMLKNAHILQKIPYYQCGLAYNNTTLKHLKFTSSGKLHEEEKATKAEEKKAVVQIANPFHIQE